MTNSEKITSEFIKPNKAHFISVIDAIPSNKLDWETINNSSLQSAEVEFNDKVGNHYKIELIRDAQSVGHRRVDITSQDGTTAYIFIDTHSVHHDKGGGLLVSGFNGRFNPSITSEQFNSVLSAIKSYSSN